MVWWTQLFKGRHPSRADAWETYVQEVCGTAVRRVRRQFQENQVHEFLARTPEAVFVVDERQRITLWNAAARELVGFRPDEVLGLHCFEVLRSRDDNGCAVCRRDCPAHRAASAGDTVPTRDLIITTKRRGPRRVCATTMVLPFSGLAHLLLDYWGPSQRA